jgi:hypothetical protein
MPDFSLSDKALKYTELSLITLNINMDKKTVSPGLNQVCKTLQIDIPLLSLSKRLAYALFTVRLVDPVRRLRLDANRTT